MPNVTRRRGSNMVVWATMASMATVLAAACAGEGTPTGSPEVLSANGSPGAEVGGSSSGSQQTAPCTTCGSSSDEDSGSGSSTGAASGNSGDDGAATTGDDDSGSSSSTGGGSSGGGLGSLFDFPDGGLSFGGSSSGSTTSTSDDGGANSCTSKVCVDPVFDCPLQGCFNGCTNFHCN